MISSAVSFISGIAVFNFFPFFPFSIITVFILTAIFLIFRAPADKKKLSLTILALAFGILYSFIRHEDIPEIKFPDKEVLIEGTIIDVPEVSFERIRFTLNNLLIEGQPVKGRIRLSAKPEIYSEMQGLMPLYGDRIKTLVRLNEPATFHNPDVYSYDPRRDRIIASGYIDQIEIVSKGRGIMAWLYKERQRLGRIIENSLSGENASFHKAIILGLRRGITPETRDAFSATGLAHLLSISGTHFALLAFIIFKIIKVITKSLPVKILTRMTLYVTPTQIAVILTMPVLILYAMISGGSTPTIRSFIMVFIYMLALFLGRRGQWLNSLAISAIIILLWQPDALFDLSFELSFIAVLSIGYVLEKSEYRRQDTENRIQDTEKGPQKVLRLFGAKIKTSILITLSATIGTAPFVVYFFHQFPLISPISNLIITPLVCFIILPFGFFLGFFALIGNMDFMPLSGLIDTITKFSLNLIKITSYIPYSNLHPHKPSIIIVTLFFISLACIIKSKSKWRLLPLAIVLYLYIFNLPFSNNNTLRITFLDVGQGDSAVVELPDKRTMLIDGGSEDYDTGRRVVAPYLWAKGIKKIDYMVLSHPHPDHYGGLIYIMDNLEVREVWLNGRMTSEGGDFFQGIQKRKIPYRVLKRGDVLETEKYKIYIFHPYDEFFADSPRGEFSNQNNNSLVLKIESGDSTTLFTGDIEIEAEENLIHLSKWLQSDIIKVPHHGGKTSSSEHFLKAVNPQIAVVSVGKNNPFNHPTKEAIERYSMIGTRLFRTDIDGAVTITPSLTPLPDASGEGVKGRVYEIKTYWDSRFKEVFGLRDEIRNLRLLF